MDRYHVVVIGGGPIGAAAAREAARSGARTLLVERRKRMEGPVPCTGLVSPRTLPTLGGSSKSIIREIRAVTAHAPDGSRLRLRSDETKGLVIDRPSLEMELLEAARSAGAEILLGTKADVKREGEITLVSESGEERLEADVIIGADGSKSRIASEFGLTCDQPPLSAAQAVIEAEPEEEDRVEVYFGRTVAPGFFGWAVPAERNRVRVGVAITAGIDPKPFLDRLLAVHFPTSRVVSRAFGLIPSRPVDRSIADRVILVGDAAGQVKPLSGGGLYTGGICARIAGRIAAEVALSGRSDRESLIEYETEWQGAIGSEIRFGLAAREALLPLDDRGINALFSSIDDPELLRFIAESGDIDRPSLLIPALIRRPHLWELVLQIARIMEEYKESVRPLGQGLNADL